ncbi:hypothetical protein B0T19DRAFT_467025 [Cercophora scortea]|uniref:Uncharacterized protein n=1 Tax=Cercophora scortea TaxID=314031 RepID=A0AAE0I700_9PEZI|nr:hypothetical protein B0T19DRAFT_467025 [Cercophora scortea]
MSSTPNMTTHPEAEIAMDSEIQPTFTQHALDSRQDSLAPNLETAFTLVDDSSITPTPSDGSTKGAPGKLTAWYYLRQWSFEFQCIVTSFACLIATIVILKVFDDHPLPNMPAYFSLNSIVALLTTIGKAAFAISISEAMSQCKWNWLRRAEQPLSDFAAFDDGSRGWWGSLALMKVTRWRNYATLGALVTVLSIATSPITQQVVGYTVKYPASSTMNATALAIRKWSHAPSTSEEDTRWQDESGYAVYQGMIGSITRPLTPIAPNCPTGNCTYPKFNSLGICVKTANITSHLQVTRRSPQNPNDWDLTQPDFAPPNETSDYYVYLNDNCYMYTPLVIVWRNCFLNTSMTYAFNGTDAMASRLLSIPIIYGLPDDPNLDTASLATPKSLQFRAIEVIFYFCVNTYEISFRQGVANTKTVASSAKQHPMSHAKPVEMDCEIDHIHTGKSTSSCSYGSRDPQADWAKEPPLIFTDPDAPPGASDPDHVFQVGAMTQTAVAFAMQRALGSWGTKASENRVIYENYGGFQLTQALYGTRPYEDGTIFASVQTYVQNIAVSLNNLMRIQSPTDVSTLQNTVTYPIVGDALENVTYIQIHWAWLSFIAVELVLATLFLAITVISTRRHKVGALKGSTLATLLAPGAEWRTRLGGVEMMAAKDERKRMLAHRVHFTGDEIVLVAKSGEEEEGEVGETGRGGGGDERGGDGERSGDSADSPRRGSDNEALGAVFEDKVQLSHLRLPVQIINCKSFDFKLDVVQRPGSAVPTRAQSIEYVPCSPQGRQRLLVRLIDYLDPFSVTDHLHEEFAGMLEYFSDDTTFGDRVGRRIEAVERAASFLKLGQASRVRVEQLIEKFSRLGIVAGYVRY